MRFTSVLYKQNYPRWFKNVWKSKSKRVILDPGAVQLVKEAGFEVEDALEVANPKLKIKETLEPGYNERDDPDWKEKTCHFFTSDTCLLEGVPHAQSITKTLLIDGLPPAIQTTAKNLALDDQFKDDINGAIFRAYIYDAYQERLPRVIDEARPCHVFPIEYGIPLYRRLDVLLNSLIRLADSYSCKMQGIEERTIHDKMYASAPIEKDGDLLQFRVSSHLTMTSKYLLTPLEVPDELVNASVPDIYPLKCTLDLEQTNVYKLIDYSSVFNAAHNPFYHTIFLTRKEEMKKWTHTQMVGRAIGTCFGFAVAQLRRIYGAEVKEVPRPILIQCIQTDGKMFDFLSYQLNTININGSDGIKNMVWLDGGRQLMNQCQLLEGDPHLDGVDYDVAKAFLALYLNGLKY